MWAKLGRSAKDTRPTSVSRNVAESVRGGDGILIRRDLHPQLGMAMSRTGHEVALGLKDSRVDFWK
jgi:hypothetical protein